MTHTLTFRDHYNLLADLCNDEDRIESHELLDSGTGYVYPSRRDKEPIARSTIITRGGRPFGVILLIRLRFDEDTICDDNFFITERNMTKKKLSEDGVESVLMIHQHHSNENMTVYCGSDKVEKDNIIRSYSADRFQEKLVLLKSGESIDFYTVSDSLDRSSRETGKICLPISSFVVQE
jgi:hypothetical protein